jgi:hypothetical protein
MPARFHVAVALTLLAVGAGLAGATSGGAAAPRGGLASRPEPPLSTELNATARESLGRHALRAGRTPPPPAPQPTELVPANRIVSVYGAPQLTATIVGRKSARAAGRQAARLAGRYSDAHTRPGLAAIDLIATIATADAGSDGKYRTRQSPELIDAYLAAARQADARLMLDIQPGRSSFRREVRAFRPWLREPDVDIALDPEWNVGRRGVPGQTEGSVGPRQVNRVSNLIAHTVRANDLPPKLLVVHQFREGSVRGEDRVLQRPGRVEVALNFDGIGSPSAKVAGYEALAEPDLFNGFSIFVRLDTRTMDPGEVVELVPPADFVMYQ